ncbi:MAG TPA: sulfotransferase [Ktedonobacteraceae bacterium]|nr:sulfotransferase [Ktedonobacteraceae bacterium]
MKTLPNFFVVGAARSGTTSLNRYLSQHPEIFITPRKEPHFFAADHFPRNGPGDEMLNQRVIADEAQYAQLFADVKGAKAVGESSVFYLCFPGTAERIAAVAPNSKIIVLLREPAARAFSAYMLLVRDGRETLEFVEGLSQEEERRQTGFEPMWWYKEAGLYYHQVKRYLDVFGTERVKVVLYDELFTHPEQTLRDVFSFLEVRPNISINTSGHYNMGGVPKSRGLYTFLYNFAGKAGPLVNKVSPLAKHIKPALAWKAIGMFLRPVEKDIQIHARLKAYFTEDVGNLEALLHQDLRHWQTQEPDIT